MFDTAELIVIFIVAFIVIGPKKFPEEAKNLGKGLGSLRKSFEEVKEHVQTEFDEIKDTSRIKEALND